MPENEVIADPVSSKYPASVLKREAEAAHEEWQAAVRRYDRRTWPKLAVVFFLAPTFVVIFRLQLEAWGYYLAGTLFAVSALVMVVLDKAAMAERDRAGRKAEAASRAYAEALSRAEAIGQASHT
jgi:hypothetical protein